MLKVFGALLILLGSIGYAGCMTGRLKRNLEVRRELLKMLQLLTGEIRHRKLNLPECFRIIAGRLSMPISGFLEELAAEIGKRDGAQLTVLWKEKATHYFEEEHLPGLQRFGEEFGFADVHIQLTAISRYEDFLQEEIREAVRKTRENGRIYSTLGILGGIFIVIVLM